MLHSQLTPTESSLELLQLHRSVETFTREAVKESRNNHGGKLVDCEPELRHAHDGNVER
jgi:hypothetical protein